MAAWGTAVPVDWERQQGAADVVAARTHCSAGWYLQGWYHSRHSDTPCLAREPDISGSELHDQPWRLAGVDSGTCAYELREVLGGRGDVSE